MTQTNYEHGVSFNAMLYDHEHKGTSCKITPAAHRMSVAIENQIIATISYDKIDIVFSGTGNKYLELKSVVNGDNITLLTSNINDAVQLFKQSANADIVEQLQKANHTKKKKIAAGYIVVTILLTVVLVVIVLINMSIGKFAEIAVDAVPVEIEQSIGRQQAQEVLAKNLVCSEENINDAVTKIGTRLVGALKNTPYKWNIKIIDSPDINAFALPGGYLFVNRGLIESATDPDELAGVLAHEISHVTKRHGLKNVIANVGLKIVVYALVGNSDAVQQFLISNASNLLAMNFSRDQETEADEEGVKLLMQARIDTNGFLRFMKKLQKESSLPEAMTFLSTHPASDDRMKNILRLTKNSKAPKNNLIIENWKKIQTECTPQKFSDPDAPL